MSMTATRLEAGTSQTVVTCYDLLDLAVRTGVYDFTDGMYQGNPATSYEEAQRNQAEYLLNQAGCGPGSRLLDIGCGYGRLLAAARRRGAFARGITISAVQAEACQRRGLEAHVMDYRAIPTSLDGQFDALIANGSLEHFVQPQDAAQGRGDQIYQEMFSICHRLLDRSSESGRLVTTAIHFGRVQIEPRDALLPPGRFPRGSDQHHFAQLAHAFGGFYPVPGQLERCARGLFDLDAEEDGTEDYFHTAEHWLGVFRRALSTNPRFLLGVIKKLLRHPAHASLMVDCLLIAQSWNWQFRGPDPPMRLLRQTWRRRIEPAALI
jgi:cyclopropane-fatty-acyl-phospholipid synthase